MSGLTLKLKTMIPTFPIGPRVKMYTAIMRQSGINNPVATVLINTLGYDLEWIRISTGLYRHIGLTPIFLENKTHLLASPNFDCSGAALNRTGDVTLDYSTYDDTWTPVDDCTAYIEVKIFQ